MSSVIDGSTKDGNTQINKMLESIEPFSVDRTLRNKINFKLRRIERQVQTKTIR